MWRYLITSIIGVIIGALMLYGYLWYQVFHKFEAAWCQVYTGELSVEAKQRCEELASDGSTLR